jgi:hypothetical protein
VVLDCFASLAMTGRLKFERRLYIPKRILRVLPLFKLR